MNILPKKRWHVRNKDNKERVRKDEENARLEDIKEKQRIALTEQEARLNLLRKKQNNQIDQLASEDNSVCVPPVQTHLNLFVSEEQEGETSHKKGNTEYEKEKRKEKESYEKKIGLLTYLGQTSLEEKRENKGPWYLEKRQPKVKKRSNESDEEYKNEDVEEKDAPRKSRLDPMCIVEKSLKRHEHKHKKQKKKKDKKHKSLSSTSSSKSIEQLRAERLQREREEREKSEKLLKGENEIEKDVGEKQSYNSQYVPHLSNQHRRGPRWKPY